MRCQSLNEFGGDVIGEDRPDMTVTGTEVLLRVTANGVCHTDLHIREGCYNLGHGKTLSFAERGMKLPRVMGHEPAGIVVAAGPDAGELDTSKNYVVFPWQGCRECHQCLDGRENYCAAPQYIGLQVDGGYADHVKIPHPRYLFDMGDMDPSIAAPLACSGLTTYSALKKVEATLTKAPVVIIGAGGLGLMCIGLVKAMGGLPPVVVDLDPAKRTAAVKAGAGAAVDGMADDAVAQVQAAVGGPALAVIDLVGAESSSGLAFDAVGKGGNIVIVGLFGGAAPWPLPLIPVKAVTIMGSYAGSLGEFEELMALAIDGKVPSLPTKEYPFDSANDILNELEAGKVVGRAVLTP
ncbi:MAG TPA: alcohol dehydrogenase [Cycloclasticus sp.]|jgi:propanol-preferring alcohol dehydrogenase|nr:alcohol dehydrogenase [Cycloclasticus sp.]HIL92854.1 alcohol dehydrogenase [Cycloclasticus sp.]